MTSSGPMKIMLVVSVVLALDGLACAQVIETPSGPIVQTRPDDGSAIAGSLGAYSLSNTLQRVHFSVSAVAGYNDNVNTSTQASSSSAYLNTNVALSYSGGNSRTRLNLSAGGGVTDYLDANRNADTNAYFALNLTHNFTHRLTLTLSAFASYQPQADLSTNLGANRQLGNFFHSTDTISLAYSWTHKISTVTSYSFGALKYDNSAGSLLNRTEQTFGEELRYLVFPTTTGVGEYRLGIITYDSAPLDSTTHYLLVGADHSFSRRLNATFRGGVELRSSQDSGYQPSPFFESTLTYAFARFGSMVWTNRYSIEEASSPGASSGAAFRTGLTLNYQFTRRLSGNFSLSYVHGDNGIGSGASSTQDTFDIGPSLHCVITHRLGADVGFRHSQVQSGAQRDSYSSNNYFGGLNFVF